MDNSTAALTWTLFCLFCLGIANLVMFFIGLWRTIVKKVSPKQFMTALSVESKIIVFYSRSIWGHMYTSSVGSLQICTQSTKPLVFPEDYKIIPCESMFERLFSSYKPED